MTRSPCRAFTAVEMLTATALAAVLMVAVLRVVASIGRTPADAAGGPSVPAAVWKAGLLETLRYDLANAREVTTEPGRLVIAGHGSLDPAAMAPGHEPVTVVYELQMLAGRTWLVRRQSPGADPAGRAAPPGAWAELLCPDVTAFAVTNDGPATGPAAARGRGGDPVPARLRVRLDAYDGPVLDEVLVVR